MSCTLRDDHTSEFFDRFLIYRLPSTNALSRLQFPILISNDTLNSLTKYAICPSVVLFYGPVLTCLFQVQENLKAGEIHNDDFRVGTLFQIPVM